MHQPYLSVQPEFDDNHSRRPRITSILFQAVWAKAKIQDEMKGERRGGGGEGSTHSVQPMNVTLPNSKVV